MLETRKDASTTLAAMLLVYCTETDNFLECYVMTMGITSGVLCHDNGDHFWSAMS